MNKDLYARIFHSTGLDGGGEFITAFFENWDKVKGSFDLVKYRLEQIANAYIYRQNEIHARIEFKRPWANAQHEVLKFDNLGDKVRLFLIDNRDVITGDETPVLTLDIARNLVTACNVEDWEKFFTEYEANLVDSVTLAKKHREENAKIIRRNDFERAKEIYMSLKDEFEDENGEPVAIEPLPFEEWLKTQSFNEVSEDDVKDFSALHNVDLREEVEKIKRQEYNLYLERCKLGIK